jgi:NAD(P)-dependent dehydrogenase (short-subunit alcohol dehydrogenase family)
LKVCFGDRDAHRGEQLASELKDCRFVHCDVTNWDNQLRLFSEAASLSSSGKIDYVVANAGIIHADGVFTFEGKSTILQTQSDSYIKLTTHRSQPDAQEAKSRHHRRKSQWRALHQ